MCDITELPKWESKSPPPSCSTTHVILTKIWWSVILLTTAVQAVLIQQVTHIAVTSGVSNGVNTIMFTSSICIFTLIDVCTIRKHFVISHIVRVSTDYVTLNSLCNSYVILVWPECDNVWWHVKEICLRSGELLHASNVAYTSVVGRID